MKYLPKETCEYLVSLGCVSEQDPYGCSSHYHHNGQEWVLRGDWYKNRSTKDIPTFSLEDILRKDNAEKIWPEVRGWRLWHFETYKVLHAFQRNPDTWMEAVAKLIKP